MRSATEACLFLKRAIGLVFGTAVIFIASIGNTYAAEPVTINFDGLYPGTIVTNQYPGAVFSAMGFSGGVGTGPYDWNIRVIGSRYRSYPHSVSSSNVAMSQNGKLRIDPKTGQMEVSPELIEKAKRQNERLRDPSFISLEIAPISNCQDEKEQEKFDCYGPNTNIRLKLLMTNRSSEAVTISMNKSFYSYDLQLFRDGQLVDYRKVIAEQVNRPPDSVRSIRIRLDPGKPEVVDVISLSAWYKRLKPGHYQLDIKRRFVLDGGWTPTGSTSFVVEAN